MLHLLGHFGSHVDGPNHFNPDGIKVAQVPLDRFVYEHPVLLDVPKRHTELIRREELEPHEAAIAEADVLVLRTGWSKIRKSDPVRYAHEGPGVAPDACTYLIEGFPASRDPLELARATLYLPTRRACRMARDAFLTALEGHAAILPRIVALGDLDEDEIIFADAATAELAERKIT